VSEGLGPKTKTKKKQKQKERSHVLGTDMAFSFSRVLRNGASLAVHT